MTEIVSLPGSTYESKSAMPAFDCSPGGKPTAHNRLRNAFLDILSPSGDCKADIARMRRPLRIRAARTAAVEAFTLTSAAARGSPWNASGTGGWYAYVVDEGMWRGREGSGESRSETVFPRETWGLCSRGLHAASCHTSKHRCSPPPWPAPLFDPERPTFLTLTMQLVNPAALWSFLPCLPSSRPRITSMRREL